MIGVIQKKITNFFTLVLANFVDVLIIRHQKFCNNMHIVYKTFIFYGFIFNRLSLVQQTPLAIKISFK